MEKNIPITGKSLKLQSKAALLLACSLAVASSSAMAGDGMSGPRSAIEPVTDKIIHVEAFLAVPPAKAFAFFTTNELLQSWLTAAADVEPRVGGKYDLFWEPADRENNSTIGCRVTALAPGQFIAFQWRSPKQFKPFANTADPLTHVVVTFAPEGAGTRVHLIQSGWRSTSEWEEARLWQERAWTGAFKKLEAITNK
jgi:uncharacterized protein YndB with AHSA1/START domain